MQHTILFVDDDRFVLSGLRRAMRESPYRILTESSPRRALGLMESENVDLVVSDLSFISTTSLLPHLVQFFSPGADGVVLIKPQFEAGREEVSRGSGIIRDRDVWVRVLHEFIDAAFGAGLEVVDLALSPITGGKGNVEFLCHLRRADILGGVHGAANPTTDR